VAALALLVVPGPAVLYIVTRSVDQGRRAGLVSVLGIHTGSLVHVFAAMAGASAALAASAGAFTALKLAGAAYLVFLGIRRLTRRSPEAVDQLDPPRAELRRVYGQGVVVQVLNPKTALFFLAFLPQFVEPSRGPVALQVGILGACFIALGLCSDATYAIVAGALSRLWAGRRFGRRLDRVSGVIYVGLGVTAALAGHPARRVAE
jgi:threonine/homoserine/homoserine lactone efflux protein